MEFKNQMWVSYNNQPHFIEHIRTQLETKHELIQSN